MEHLIPTPDTLPAPAWIFTLLGLVTLTLHFLVMNAMLGGSILATARRLRPSLPVPDLSRPLPILFALAINLGVAPLLFLQVTHGHLVYTSSILMGVFWMTVVPLLIVAYYSAYGSRNARAGLSTVFSLLTTVILVWIAFIYTNNMSLMAQPAHWGAPRAGVAGTLLPLGDPAIWPRFLHVVVASIAVAALFDSLRAACRARRGGPAADHSANLRIVAVTTLIQVAVGLWHLFVLPDGPRSAALGGSGHVTGTLWLGVAVGVGAGVSAWRGKLRPTVIQLGITMFLMVVARDGIRSAYLKPVFNTRDLAVQIQWSPLLAFLVVFALGLGVVAWLVRVATRPPARPPEAAPAQEEVAS